MTEDQFKKLLQFFRAANEEIAAKLKSVENDPALSSDEKFDKMASILKDLPLIPMVGAVSKTKEQTDEQS